MLYGLWTMSFPWHKTMPWLFLKGGLYAAKDSSRAKLKIKNNGWEGFHNQIFLNLVIFNQ